MGRIHQVGDFNPGFQFKDHFQSEQRTFKTLLKVINGLGNGMRAEEEHQELRTETKGRGKLAFAFKFSLKYNLVSL